MTGGDYRHLLRVLDRVERIEKDRERLRQKRIAEKNRLSARYAAYKAAQDGEPVPWECAP